MSYRVFWDPYAEDQLNDILQDVAIRPKAISAAHAIDRKLISDPFDFGESRFAQFRIAFVRPLAVLYEVLADIRTVVVCEVWRVD